MLSGAIALKNNHYYYHDQCMGVPEKPHFRLEHKKALSLDYSLNLYLNLYLNVYSLKIFIINKDIYI